eukprot:COSAG01_NODE_24081_length_791_cov_1.092486_1_plen_25_part_10
MMIDPMISPRTRTAGEIKRRTPEGV